MLKTNFSQGSTVGEVSKSITFVLLIISIYSVSDIVEMVNICRRYSNMNRVSFFDSPCRLSPLYKIGMQELFVEKRSRMITIYAEAALKLVSAYNNHSKRMFNESTHVRRRYNITLL